MLLVYYWLNVEFFFPIFCLYFQYVYLFNFIIGVSLSEPHMDSEAGAVFFTMEDRVHGTQCSADVAWQLPDNILY